jgi:hypothetical protein
VLSFNRNQIIAKETIMLLTPYEREKLKAFANLNSDSKRDEYAQYNPEVKTLRFAIEALLVAQGGWQKKEIPVAWMYSIAAFFLGGEIPDIYIGAEAATRRVLI